MCKLKKQNKHQDLQCKINEQCETKMIKYLKMFNATKYYACCFNKQVTRSKKQCYGYFQMSHEIVLQTVTGYSDTNVVSIQVFSVEA